METGVKMGLRFEWHDKFTNNLVALCAKNSEPYYRDRELDALVDTVVAYELKKMRRYHRRIGRAIRGMVRRLLRRYQRLLSAERRLDWEARNKAD